MAALLTQGNSESDKYRFNTAFLTGSDYYRYLPCHYRKAEKPLRLFTHKANPTVLFVALRHGKAVFLKGGAHLLFARVDNP